MNARTFTIEVAIAVLLASAAPAGTLRDEQRLSPDEAAEEVRDAESDEAAASMARAGARAAASGRFASAYARAGSPRIAVFVNRELSDEVREFQPIAGVQSAVSVTHTGKDGRAEHLDGVAQHQSFIAVSNDGQRSPRAEDWLWEFEHGFESPFLAARAKLVDRATIVRLAANGESRNSVEYASLSPKRVETSALIGHADLFVEVLVTDSPRSPTGFRFKATVKEVRTGRILASLVSDDGGASENPKASRVVATASGYSIVEDTEAVEIDGIARGLATQVMAELAQAWS